MRKVLSAVLVTVVTGGWLLAGTAQATVGDPSGDTVNYVYTGSSSPDSGTCGNDWANDTMTRTYQVYPDQNVDGSYRVVETFTKGKFTTVQGPSPESCEAGTGNTVSGSVKGTFQGNEVLKVTDGTYASDEDVQCASPCVTADFVAAAFGPSATYAVPDYFFKYKAKNAAACAKTWINSGTGNSGDIATFCAPATAPTASQAQLL
jgi:hypothetical protein